MFGLSLSNGQSASFDWDDKSGTFFSTKDPNARLDVPGTRGFHGNAAGGLQGTKFDFTVNWVSDTVDFDTGPEKITSHFTGTIVDSSTARGKAVDNKGASVDWTAQEPFVCADAPAPQADPAPQGGPAGPTKCTGLGIAPPGKTCADLAKPPEPAKVAPTNAVRVTFDRSLVTWTANVTNSADIAGKCTYKATNPVLPGVNKSFSIDPNGTASFPVLAPPIGSTYHVVTSCHGTFDGKDVEFGHDEQDVSLGD
jgi:hypothetical protein